MKSKLLLLCILFLSIFTSCQKDPSNENNNESNDPVSPQQVEEDWSYIRVLESKTFRKSGSSTFQDINMVYKYDGDKLIGKERYVDGIKQYENIDFNYTNLSVTWTYRFYGNNATEADCYAEYTDNTFRHIKYEQGLYSNGSTSKSYYEYDGNKTMGQKFFTNDKLTRETFNYQWDSLRCTCTTNIYDTVTGNVIGLNEFVISYLDNTYSRPLYEHLKSISYSYDGNEHISLTETYNQYEGKKIVSTKTYIDGIIREEYKDYVYDGNRCSFKQIIYDTEGQMVFEGEGYIVYYNP